MGGVRRRENTAGARARARRAARRGCLAALPVDRGGSHPRSIFFSDGHLYFRGAGIDCGCFGVGEPLSAKTLARDGALLAAAIALVVYARRPVSN